MTRLQAWLSGLCLVSSMLASSAGAQQQQQGVTKTGLDSLRRAVGFRVRLRDAASPSWQFGTLGPVNDETLILHSGDDTKIPTQSLIAAQRSLGKARYNPTMAGFFIGLVGGGVAGYFVGDANRKTSQPNGSQRTVGTAVGMAVGAGLGALIGAAIAPEHWRDIRLR